MPWAGQMRRRAFTCLLLLAGVANVWAFNPGCLKVAGLTGAQCSGMGTSVKGLRFRAPALQLQGCAATRSERFSADDVQAGEIEWAAIPSVDGPSKRQSFLKAVSKKKGLSQSLFLLCTLLATLTVALASCCWLMQHPAGNLAVVAELKTKDPAFPEFKSQLPSITDFSQALHDAKISGVAVWMEESLFGTSHEGLKEAVDAQASFKGNFPGPCPVLACGLFKDAEQLKVAAGVGASAVLLSATVLADLLASRVETTKALGLEAVVLCSSRLEMDAAVAAGAQIVAVDCGVLGVDGGLEAIEGLELDVPLLAFGGVTDIAHAWALRIGGFGSVVVGEMLMEIALGKEGELRQSGGKDGLSVSTVQGDMLRTNDIKALIKGLTSKASPKFASSDLNSFRERGAKYKQHYVV